jgi:hypothetical protein
MTKNEWYAKLHELAFEDTRLDKIPFVCFDVLAECIAKIEAAQQSVERTCEGHVGGSYVKEWICQTCGLPIPHSG